MPRFYGAGCTVSMKLVIEKLMTQINADDGFQIDLFVYSPKPDC